MQIVASLNSVSSSITTMKWTKRPRVEKWLPGSELAYAACVCDDGWVEENRSISLHSHSRLSYYIKIFFFFFFFRIFMLICRIIIVIASQLDFHLFQHWLITVIKLLNPFYSRLTSTVDLEKVLIYSLSMTMANESSSNDELRKNIFNFFFVFSP